MKKIILGLFLVLGIASFAVPKYVNTTKLQSAGYEITTDDEDLFSFGKATQEAGISVAFYPMPKETPKAISDAVKNSAPDGVKFISSLENKRAYVLKFKDGEVYTYNFVPKKQKSKDCHISVLYMTDKDLSGASLNKAVDSSVNEAESFLK
ncbi:hypothetical protein LDJ98_09080 [Fusobacterium nucleatum]|uniref:hypothetical protein n=1 Tax=Fusobacterium nucleatum TaxID=851 RepID=UPI0030D385B6